MYEKFLFFFGSEGVFLVVFMWFIMIWILLLFDCLGRGGGGGGVGGLFKLSLFIIFLRFNISFGLDDCFFFFLLFWMIFLRILIEVGVVFLFLNVIEYVFFRFVCVEVCIFLWILFVIIGVELGLLIEIECM